MCSTSLLIALRFKDQPLSVLISVAFTTHYSSNRASSDSSPQELSQQGKGGSQQFSVALSHFCHYPP